MAGTIIATFRNPNQSNIDSEDFNPMGNLISADWEKGVLNDGAYYVTDENSKSSRGGYEKGTSWGPAKKGDMSKVIKYFGADAKTLKVGNKAISEYKSPKELQQALRHAGYVSLQDDNYAGSETMNTLLNYLRGDNIKGTGQYLSPRSRTKLTKKTTPKQATKTETTVVIKTPTGTKKVSKTIVTRNKPSNKPNSKSNLESYMAHPHGNGTVTPIGTLNPLEAMGFTYNPEEDGYVIGESIYVVTPNGHLSKVKGNDEFHFNGRAINDKFLSQLEALSNSKKSLSPEWKMIAQEQAAKGNDLVSQLYREDYLFNPATNSFENKNTGKSISKYSYPEIRTINFTPTMHFKTGGTLKKNLTHKFQKGGWIGDKSKGIWNYSDGPKDIQKKIAKYYINMWQSDEDINIAKNYLKNHSELAEYLDKAYQKGIDWKGQRALGNIPSQEWSTYRNSKGQVNYTDEITTKDRDNYAKSLGYKNESDMHKQLKAAGYKPWNLDTYTKKNNDGSEQQYHLINTPGKGLGIVGEDGARATVDKKSLQPIIARHRAYLVGQAKKNALHSKKSVDWAKAAKFAGRSGHFYADMTNAGYSYDTDKGTYTKDGVTYTVDGSGKVYRQGKSGGTQIGVNNLFK